MNDETPTSHPTSVVANLARQVYDQVCEIRRLLRHVAALEEMNRQLSSDQDDYGQILAAIARITNHPECPFKDLPAVVEERFGRREER